VSYVVNWQRSDGGQAWHAVGEVQEAANFAEHLRNAEGVDAARIYRLEEVAFAYRPYFRVELEAVSEPVPAWTAPPPAEVVNGPEPEPETAELNGARRGLFGR
jgi:hypothetical protein